MCSSLNFIILFEFLNILLFSLIAGSCLMPCFSNWENTVNQPRPQQNDVLGMRLTVNGTSKF